MPVKRNASFGTYFVVGVIGMLIGSVIGNVLVKNVFRPGAVTDLISLYGYANKFYIHAGYNFNLNLIAVIGIILAIYIYRRI